MQCYNLYNPAYNDNEPSAQLAHASYNVNVDPPSIWIPGRLITSPLISTAML
jgi:hypothetical protein